MELIRCKITIKISYKNLLMSNWAQQYKHAWVYILTYNLLWTKGFLLLLGHSFNISQIYSENWEYTWEFQAG